MVKVRTYKRHGQETKVKAIALWKQGKTYEEIGKDIGVAKGTLSDWLRSKYPRPEHVRVAQLEKARKASQTHFEQQRSERSQALGKKVAGLVKTLNSDDKHLQMAVLAMLYWAEGAKTEKQSGISFANTDPELSKLFIKMLRSHYSIDESRLRVRLHLHYYHPIKTTRIFWAKTLGIPENQFQSVYIKKRSRNKRFRKNFMGISMIRYYDNQLKNELIALAYAIKDKMLG